MPNREPDEGDATAVLNDVNCQAMVNAFLLQGQMRDSSSGGLSQVGEEELLEAIRAARAKSLPPGSSLAPQSDEDLAEEVSPYLNLQGGTLEDWEQSAPDDACGSEGECEEEGEDEEGVFGVYGSRSGCPSPQGGAQPEDNQYPCQRGGTLDNPIVAHDQPTQGDAGAPDHGLVQDVAWGGVKKGPKALLAVKNFMMGSLQSVYTHLGCPPPVEVMSQIDAIVAASLDTYDMMPTERVLPGVEIMDILPDSSAAAYLESLRITVDAGDADAISTLDQLLQQDTLGSGAHVWDSISGVSPIRWSPRIPCLSGPIKHWFGSVLPGVAPISSFDLHVLGFLGKSTYYAATRLHRQAKLSLLGVCHQIPVLIRVRDSASDILTDAKHIRETMQRAQATLAKTETVATTSAQSCSDLSGIVNQLRSTIAAMSINHAPIGAVLPTPAANMTAAKKGPAQPSAMVGTKAQGGSSSADSKKKLQPAFRPVPPPPSQSGVQSSPTPIPAPRTGAATLPTKTRYDPMAEYYKLHGARPKTQAQPASTVVAPTNRVNLYPAEQAGATAPVGLATSSSAGAVSSLPGGRCKVAAGGARQSSEPGLFWPIEGSAEAHFNTATLRSIGVSAPSTKLNILMFDGLPADRHEDLMSLWNVLNRIAGLQEKEIDALRVECHCGLVSANRKKADMTGWVNAMFSFMKRDQDGGLVSSIYDRVTGSGIAPVVMLSKKH